MLWPLEYGVERYLAGTVVIQEAVATSLHPEGEAVEKVLRPLLADVQGEVDVTKCRLKS